MSSRQSGGVGSAVVVGDEVEIEMLPSGHGVIEAVQPRRTAVCRRSAGGRGDQIIVANLVRLVIVMPGADPPPRWGMLDRYLVLAEDSEIEPVIVISKCDLLAGQGAAEVERETSVYRGLGYDVIMTSAATGAGLDEVRGRLAGVMSALVGASGVGKSSLLNALDPEVAQAVGQVSESTGKGKHTTSSSRLFPLRILDQPSWLADTPGVRELGLSEITPLRLSWCMREFRQPMSECRFQSDCTHTHEIGCRVKDAVERGTITLRRYESYRRMLSQDDA